MVNYAIGQFKKLGINDKNLIEGNAILFSELMSNTKEAYSKEDRQVLKEYIIKSVKK